MENKLRLRFLDLVPNLWSLQPLLPIQIKTKQPLISVSPAACVSSPLNKSDNQKGHSDYHDDTYLFAVHSGWCIVISARRDVGADKVSFKNAGVSFSTTPEIGVVLRGWFPVDHVPRNVTLGNFIL